MVVTYCMKSRYSKKCGNTCFLVTCLRHNFWLRLLTVARSRWQHWTSTEYATQSALNNGKNKKAVKPIRQLHCTETERRSEIVWQLPIHDNLDAALQNQNFHTTSLTCKQNGFLKLSGARKFNGQTVPRKHCAACLALEVDCITTRAKAYRYAFSQQTNQW